MPSRLNTQAAAAYIGKSVSWLNQSRCRGDGPPYYKVGANVFYASADIDSWLEGQKRTQVYRFGDNDNRRVARAAAA